MRRLVVLAVISAGLLAPSSAGAAPPILEHGRFAGDLPPATPWEPDLAPIKSFKIELIG